MGSISILRPANGVNLFYHYSKTISHIASKIFEYNSIKAAVISSGLSGINLGVGFGNKGGDRATGHMLCATPKN